MMDKSKPLSEQAISFAQNLLYIYLVKRDFSKLKTLLHTEISGIGTGIYEVYDNYNSALEVLQKEELACGSNIFQILEQGYTALILSEDKVLVSCTLKIKEDGLNTLLTVIPMRISMLVCFDSNQNGKLLHWHWSVPNHAQDQGDFVPKVSTENYTTLLENTLNERTQLLKEQTIQLEMLANNIQGGMQICDFDSSFTIRYANDSFYEMIGYTRAEVKELFANLHTAFVHKDDIDKLRTAVDTQLSKSNHFSVEYRLIHKSGSIVWVIDNGTVLYKNNKPSQVQCIITDITAQKQQAEDLKLSETRYQIVLRQFDLSMFEYDLTTRQLTLFEKDANLYNVATVVENGPETLIAKGAIMADTAPGYREMYRKIHAGEPFANCYINSKDTNNIIREYELTMTNIFNDNGQPIRAIGTKKDISQLRMLQREQKFNQTMTLNKKFIMEVNITTNTIISAATEWVSRGIIEANKPYSEVIASIANKFIVEDYCGFFIKSLSPKYLTDKYNNGEIRVVFPYRFVGKTGVSQWYEAIANIIKDEIQGDLTIRLYNLNINERKLKEENAEKEKLLYESMLAKAILAYELNLTKDAFIKGNGKWRELYEIDTTSNYSEMVQLFGKVAVHPADRELFYNSLSKTEIIRNFYNGIREFSFEYRRMSGRQEKMRWSIAKLHVYEDPQNGDIKAYAYIEDIHEQKNRELDLRYRAEHDLMTGLYNKEVTMQLIKNFLSINISKSQKHALLIIDIDNLKYINDSFGHLVGDEAINTVAAQIKNTFTEQNITGRIGGDEFCVFIKDVRMIESVYSKAQKICKNVSESKRSVSIGVAFYPQNGSTYEELFKSADDALYRAKRNGKNQYA